MFSSHITGCARIIQGIASKIKFIIKILYFDRVNNFYLFILKSLQSGNVKKLKNCLIDKTELAVIIVMLMIIVSAISVFSMPKMFFKHIII